MFPLSSTNLIPVHMLVSFCSILCLRKACSLSRLHMVDIVVLRSQILDKRLDANKVEKNIEEVSDLLKCNNNNRRYS